MVTVPLPVAALVRTGKFWRLLGPASASLEQPWAAGLALARRAEAAQPARRQPRARGPAWAAG